VVGSTRSSIDGAVIDQETTFEGIVTDNDDGGEERRYGIVTLFAKNGSGVNTVSAGLGVVPMSIVAIEIAEAKENARFALSRTIPSGFSMASRITSISRDGVVVVTFFGSSFVTITTNSLARLSNCRADPSGFYLARARATIFIFGISVITLFLSNLHGITTNGSTAGEFIFSS